jgi:hypothetical protein
LTLKRPKSRASPSKRGALEETQQQPKQPQRSSTEDSSGFCLARALATSTAAKYNAHIMTA